MSNYYYVTYLFSKLSTSVIYTLSLSCGLATMTLLHILLKAETKRPNFENWTSRNGFQNKSAFQIYKLTTPQSHFWLLGPVDLLVYWISQHLRLKFVVYVRARALWFALCNGLFLSKWKDSHSVGVPVNGLFSLGICCYPMITRWANTKQVECRLLFHSHVASKSFKLSRKCLFRRSHSVVIAGRRMIFKNHSRIHEIERFLPFRWSQHFFGLNSVGLSYC